MTRRRLVLAVIVVAVAAIVGIGLLQADAEDTPEAAVYAIAHGIEHRDAETVCDRLFPSTALPRGTARALRVASAGNASTSWEDDHRACLRDFGKNGEFESFGFEDPRVRRVTAVRIDPAGGITGAAQAMVASGQGEARPLNLVEYRGRWRLVLEVN
jgi:hypothetical protein